MSNSSLMEVANKYSSKEEFRVKNPLNYYKAKRKVLLSKMFPKVKPTKVKGIFKLYRRNAIIYIGHTLVDIPEAVKALRETINFERYSYYSIASSADILVMSIYLVNKHRPILNTNVGKERLTFSIPNHKNILGKQFKGALDD